MSALTFPPPKMTNTVSPCRDADHINAIMNADGVREFMKLSDDEGDVTGAMGRVSFLANEHGFFAIDPKAANCYEFHSAILPASRGRDGYKLARSACEFMFLNTDAVELHTFTPNDNPTATPPKSFGFREWFKNKEGTFYRAHIMDWAKNAPNLESWGEWFHQSLEAAKEAHGATIDAHDDDRVNNRYAGLACALIAAGNEHKGIWAYNHWATTAGYHPVELISVDPIEINTGDAVIRFHDNNAEFISCQ